MLPSLGLGQLASQQVPSQYGRKETVPPTSACCHQADPKKNKTSADQKYRIVLHVMEKVHSVDVQVKRYANDMFSYFAWHALVVRTTATNAQLGGTQITTIDVTRRQPRLEIGILYFRTSFYMCVGLFLLLPKDGHCQHRNDNNTNDNTRYNTV